MAYTTIHKSTDNFNTKLWTGNGSAGHSITGVGFQPDWTWIKVRCGTGDHGLWDSVRGVSKRIQSNEDSAETTTSGVTAFGTDGFTMGTAYNVNGDNYASWNWKAGNSSGSSNSDGSITSTVSANTTAGFTIVKYVGTGSGSNSTVGHGLGVKPAMIIVKNLGSNGNWVVWHKSLASETNSYLRLDTNAAPGTTTNYWNSAAPTNQVFGVSPDGYNNNKDGENIIAYCFAEKTGYSKFGSYAGNGNVDGNFLYTGFKPAFLMVKRYDTSGNWVMFDNKRSSTGGNNEINYALLADSNSSESTGTSSNDVDFLSNGIKIREDNGDLNTSGGTYIYMAFGQSIVGSNNIPTTAK